MTDKKLRKLRRAALIELLIEQMEENECLTEEKKILEQKLHEREITIQNAGSIAEAALLLNDVFLAAENAATQYVDNLASLNAKCDEILDNAQREAARIVSEAQRQAQQPLPEPEEYQAVSTSASGPEQDAESGTEYSYLQPTKEAVEHLFDDVFAQMHRRNK